MTNKPLYKYKGNPEIFRCPLDRGDEISVKNIGVVVTNCYAQYGTSCMAPWMYDRMGIKYVYGSAAEPKDHHSMKQSDIAVSPADKIMLGDWDLPSRRSSPDFQKPLTHSQTKRHVSHALRRRPCAKLELAVVNRSRVPQKPGPQTRFQQSLLVSRFQLGDKSL